MRSDGDDVDGRVSGTNVRVRAGRRRSISLDDDNNVRFAAMPDYLLRAPLNRRQSRIELHEINPTVSHIERLAQKRGINTADERFRVLPDYAYPNARMNRDELRREMNKKSHFFHTLDTSSDSSTKDQPVGQISLEVLQCFGLPRPDSTLSTEISAFVVAVCGRYAFRTDTMPPVANPMWLCRMRRACIFPLWHAYAKVYLGVFGHSESSRRDAFAGRVVVDVAQLRPGSTYDITLPLRRSAHVYSREQRGALRFRIHLHWHDERSAILSYLPRRIPKMEPNEEVTVRCCDAKSFQNVARVVHGDHMPGRFSTRQLQATFREITYTQIHLLRYIRKRELRHLHQWRVPLISAFVFGAWMHCVWTASVTYIPGHFVTLMLLYIWKNYAHFRLNEAMQNGFLAPSWEEMFLALIFGRRQGNIAPLEIHANQKRIPALENVTSLSRSLARGEVVLEDVADAVRTDIKLHNGRYRLQNFHNVVSGSEVVDFLVQREFASTREDAVVLGNRLITELSVLRSVAGEQHFKDDESFYQVLKKYEIKTYRPKGAWIFRILGLMPKEQLQLSDAHTQQEMPFASGRDHPRLKVKEALVIRSKESQKLLLEETIESRNKQRSQSQQLADGLDAFLRDQDDQESQESTAETAGKTQELTEESGYEIKVLPKPPQQDINFKSTKKAKTLSETMIESRERVHAYLAHAFNDRVYIKPSANSSTRAGQTRRPFRARMKDKIKLGLCRRRDDSESVANLSDDSELSTMDPVQRQDEFDRILGIGKYSHKNRWISRIGVIIQPLLEMALAFLCMFRALFNIFTWKDPMLTFWCSVIGPIVVIFLHVFPYRLVMGLAGILLVGPHNWIMRIYREHKHGPDVFDPDTLVKRKKSPRQVDHMSAPLFSMCAPDNRPISKVQIQDGPVYDVVIPYSQLTYQRFYDFPPEMDYARVVAEGPPSEERKNPARAVLSESITSCGHSTSSGESSGERSLFRRRRGLRRRRRRENEVSHISTKS